MAPQSDIRISTNPVGTHTRNTSIDSAVTLDAPTGAERILIQAESQSIRYRIDSQNPTSTVGFLMKAGDPPLIIQCKSLRVISASAGASIQYIWLS